jgi:hypothetical protein
LKGRRQQLGGKSSEWLGKGGNGRVEALWLRRARNKREMEMGWAGDGGIGETWEEEGKEREGQDLRSIFSMWSGAIRF